MPDEYISRRARRAEQARTAPAQMASGSASGRRSGVRPAEPPERREQYISPPAGADKGRAHGGRAGGGGPHAEPRRAPPVGRPAPRMNGMAQPVRQSAAPAFGRPARSAPRGNGGHVPEYAPRHAEYAKRQPPRPKPETMPQRARKSNSRGSGAAIKRMRRNERKLRQMRRLNVVIRAICVMLITLASALWPVSLSPDGGPLNGVNPAPPYERAASSPAPTMPPLITPQPLPARVTISAAGDCTLGYDPRLGYTNSLPHELERQDGDYGYFFRNVYPVFAADDFTVVNLECALTCSDDRAEGKTFCFKGDPLYRNILIEGSVEVVSLGNNHARDYKAEGFSDTMETLRTGDIGFAVNGMSCIKSANGVRVGFLSYRNHTPELYALKSDIASLRAQACDLVICSFHWGEEYRNVANAAQRRLGRAAIDYGADLVLGHHPHVIGSIERYKGRYICYSLGNFCFGGNRNPQDKDTFIFRQTFEMDENGIMSDAGIEIVPCRISSTTSRNNYQPTIYSRDDALRVLERLNDYSSPLDYGMQFDESVLKCDW